MRTRRRYGRRRTRRYGGSMSKQAKAAIEVEVKLPALVVHRERVALLKDEVRLLREKCTLLRAIREVEK